MKTKYRFVYSERIGYFGTKKSFFFSNFALRDVISDAPGGYAASYQRVSVEEVGTNEINDTFLQSQSCFYAVVLICGHRRHKQVAMTSPLLLLFSSTPTFVVEN